jgi:hypothetical protein
MPLSQDTDNRRKYYRNSTQKVVLIIEETPYLVLDWSPEGFSVLYEKEKLSSGDEIKGQVDVFELEELGSFTGTVIRHNEENILAVQFTDLSSHVFLNFCVSLVNTEAETED